MAKRQSANFPGSAQQNPIPQCGPYRQCDDVGPIGSVEPALPNLPRISPHRSLAS